MPLLRKPVLLPSKGVDFSKPATMINDRAGFPKNMRFSTSEVKSRFGKTKYGSVAIPSSQVMGMGLLKFNTGGEYLYRASKTKIQRYSASTDSWVDKTGGLGNLTGDDDDLVNFIPVTESGLILATNFQDAIRKASTGDFALLGGSPPKAKYGCYLAPYILLANIDDGVSLKPWKVVWNDTDNPEAWSGGNSGGELLSDEPSHIKNIIKLNEFAACYKENSLWIGRKLTSSDIFDFSCIKTGIGLACPRGVADHAGQHYFIGNNDFYVWNGVAYESIGAAVRDQAFSLVDRSKLNRCFAFNMADSGEIWFFMVRSGEDWPTDVWKYSYLNGFWYYDTCSSITSMIAWYRSSDQSWDEDVGSGSDGGTWDEATDAWDDSISTADSEDYIFGRDDGHTLSYDKGSFDDDGNAVQSEFVTKDYLADKFEDYKRWLQLDMWAHGIGTIKIAYSTDFGNTWIYITEKTLTETVQKFQLYFDIVAPQIRFKFYNYDSGEGFTLQNFYPFYLGRAQIR